MNVRAHSTENISDLGSYVCNLMDSDGEYLADYALIWRYNMIGMFLLGFIVLLILEPNGKYRLFIDVLSGMT